MLIRNGKAEYVEIEAGMVLAAMGGMVYKEHTLELKNGDILFIYTDGVTEAMDHDLKQYGEDRLIKLLSFGEDYPEPTEPNGIAESVCRIVKEDINSFVCGAEQSDDITMLCIKYQNDPESADA